MPSDGTEMCTNNPRVLLAYVAAMENCTHPPPNTGRRKRMVLIIRFTAMVEKATGTLV